MITAELSNWNGKAIKIPRIEVGSCDRDDITQAGIYFLFYKEDDGSDSVYIGEAENVKERLVKHLRDYQSEKEKYYWSIVVIFAGRDLNKALIRYLENRFVEIARSSKRYRVEHGPECCDAPTVQETEFTSLIVNLPIQQYNKLS